MIEIERVLFPIDFTENASKVLPYVLSIAEKYDAVVYLLHVVEDLSRWGSASYIPHIPLGQYREEALRGAEKTLERVCDEQLQRCPNFQKMIFVGDPAQEILKAIDSENIDLVIMGTHGRKGLQRLLMGSVTERTIGYADHPVMVIH